MAWRAYGDPGELFTYVFWSRWKYQPFLSTADSSRIAEGVGPQSCVNKLTLTNYLKNRDTQRHSTIFERSRAEPRDRSLD